MAEPDLTPAQERAVRAHLAGARHDEVLPPEVAARLDAVLAGLVAERPSDPPVVPIASRRRRIAAASLVAAAAVVVGGVAIGQVVDDGAGSDSVGSLAEDAGAGQAGPTGSGESARRPRGRGSASEDESDAGASTDPSTGPSTDLSSQNLRRDVRSLAPVAGGGALLADGTAPCRVVGGAGPGDRVRVTYDGRDGLLVFRAPVGDVQRVDLYLCGSDGVTRTVILHAR